MLEPDPDALATSLEAQVAREAGPRKRMVSIGILILLSDRERPLRGPRIKSDDACHGRGKRKCSDIG
jgi:hypothetical protein